jgi:hypothetical protein
MRSQRLASKCISLHGANIRLATMQQVSFFGAWNDRDGTKNSLLMT